MHYNKVKCGSHLLTHLTHWPTEQSGCDWLVTYMLIFKSSWCNMTWKIFDMKQCHRFLHSWQVTGWFLAQISWRWNLWTSHASKQLEIKIALFTLTIFQYIHQTQSSLTYQMLTLISKNMWYPGHIQII